MLQNVLFFALAPRPGFEATISDVIVYKKASVCVKSFLCKNLLCVKASQCKGVLCVKDSVCKSAKDCCV